MISWIIVILLTIALVWLVFGASFAKKTILSTREIELAVYKEQLSSLKDDVERGLIAPSDVETSKLEISKRILKADQSDKTRSNNEPISLKIRLITATLLMLASFGLYSTLGQPKLPDQPLKQRIATLRDMQNRMPTQDEIEAKVAKAFPNKVSDIAPEHKKLLDQLEIALTNNPDDARGQELMAKSMAGVGDYVKAHKAQAKLIALTDNPTDQIFATHAEYLVMAANGFVSEDAQNALKSALSLNPQNGVAHYFSGVMYLQNGQPEKTLEIFDALLAKGPADARWILPIKQQIDGVRQTVNGTALKGPTEDEIKAANDMSSKDRNDMIQSMVDQLSERLATEGGTPTEWAKLINALQILGNTEKAQAIYNEATVRFKEQPEAMEVINAVDPSNSQPQ